MVVLILVLITAYFIFNKNDYSPSSNTPVENISEELINTEQEAINFAEKDKEFGKCDIAWRCNADWDEEDEVWTVIGCKYYQNEPIYDACYGISFNPEGTILGRHTDFA